jgi:hypothetical protein
MRLAGCAEAMLQALTERRRQIFRGGFSSR